MQTTGYTKIVLLAIVGLTDMSISRVAVAAPPVAQPPKPPVAQNLSSIAERLDLRMPTHLFASEDKAQGFPSATIHRQFGGVDETAQLPSLGAGNQRVRPPMADLVRHIQHEGLPVARLWENKSALLHLGLNSKGKPGLWLVQKIH